MDRPAVQMKNITKVFNDIRANDSIDFTLKKGSIHGLLGENGTGKTTLMNVLYGLYQAEEGEIYINGKREYITSPTKAISLGIGMVHQHFMLARPFSVVENVMLGKKSTRGILQDTKKTADELSKLSRRTQKHLEDRLEAYAHAVDYKFETPEEIYPFLTEEFKSKMSKDEFVDAFNKERSYPYITGLYFYDPVVQDGSTDECGTVVYTQAARLPGMTYTIKYKFENGDYYIDDWEDFLDGSYLDKFQNTPYTLDWYYDPDNNTK